MDVANTQAVVTGAASGIGEAIAQRLLEAGACVVIGDLDAVRLEETSSRLDADHPGRIAHVDGDASDPDHVAELIASAGDVDIFFANAGVFKGFGLQATDDEWDLSWDVNVKAHVVAARALVPTWLERGAGCFVSTASVADLLRHQACRGWLCRMACSNIWRPRRPGVLPVPDGRAYRHASRRRDGRRR